MCILGTQALFASSFSLLELPWWRIASLSVICYKPTYDVRAQVNEQDSDGANGQWDAGYDVDEEGAELSNILGQCVGNRFL